MRKYFALTTMFPGLDPPPPPLQWSQNALPAALRHHSWWCRAAPPWSYPRTRLHPRRCHRHHHHHFRLTYHQWTTIIIISNHSWQKRYFVTYSSGQLICEHGGLHAQSLRRLLYVDCSWSHWFQNLLRSWVTPGKCSLLLLLLLNRLFKRFILTNVP